MGRRLVRTMGQRLGVTLTRRQVEAVLGLGTGGMVSLPGGLCGVRLAHRLLLRREEALPPPLLLEPGRQVWGPWQVTLRRTLSPEDWGPDTLALDAAAGPLTVGAWDGTGRLAVENGSRTLKRLFQDRGIPAERRGEHPVLYAGGRPAAALGVAVDRDLAPREGRPCLAVTFTTMTDTTERKR